MTVSLGVGNGIGAGKYGVKMTRDGRHLCHHRVMMMVVASLGLNLLPRAQSFGLVFPWNRRLHGGLSFSLMKLGSWDTGSWWRGGDVRPCWCLLLHTWQVFPHRRDLGVAVGGPLLHLPSLVFTSGGRRLVLCTNTRNILVTAQSYLTIT